MNDIALKDLENSARRIIDVMFYGDLKLLSIKLDTFYLSIENLYLTFLSKKLSSENFEKLSSELNAIRLYCNDILEKLGGSKK